jgi:hypothetical protein
VTPSKGPANISAFVGTGASLPQQARPSVFVFCIPNGAVVKSPHRLGALRDAVAQLSFFVWLTGGALGGDQSGRVRALVPTAQVPKFRALARNLIVAYATSDV